MLCWEGYDSASIVDRAPLAKTLSNNEQQIIDELNAVQGSPVDIDGYFVADPEKTKAVMRPSATLNAAIAAAQVR